MSNKLVKEKTPEKETSVKAWYGRVLLVCGIVWLVILMVMWIFPTNLDGKPLKLIISAVWLMLGILQCVIGIYWIVKKPKVKLGKFLAKAIAKDLKMDNDEIVEIMKDFEY